MSLSGAELSKLNGVTMESLQEDITRLKKLHDANALKDEADALLADSFKVAKCLYDRFKSEYLNLSIIRKNPWKSIMRPWQLFQCM